jgi:hypothetical protein
MKLKQIAAHFCICATAAVALLGEVWAGPDSDAVREFGLPGWWMIDCTKPVSARNRAVGFEAPELTQPFAMMGDGTASVMRDVRIIAPDRLVYTENTIKYGDTVVELVKRDGRLRVDKMTVKRTGEVLVKDGGERMVPYEPYGGERTRLYEPCQRNLSALPRSTGALDPDVGEGEFGIG